MNILQVYEVTYTLPRPSLFSLEVVTQPTPPNPTQSRPRMKTNTPPNETNWEPL